MNFSWKHYPLISGSFSSAGGSYSASGHCHLLLPECHLLHTSCWTFSSIVSCTSSFFFLFSIGSSIISWISGLSFFGVGDCSFSLKVFAFYIEFSYPRDKRSVNSTFSCTIFKISDLKTTFGAMLRMHS